MHQHVFADIGRLKRHTRVDEATLFIDSDTIFSPRRNAAVIMMLEHPQRHPLTLRERVKKQKIGPGASLSISTGLVVLTPVERPRPSSRSIVDELLLHVLGDPCNSLFCR